MTNEELKAAIIDFNNAYNYEEDNEEHVKLFEGRYPDIFEYWRELDIITQAARELSQLKDGTHPDMVMVPNMVMVPREVVNFLNGTGELEGVCFGEKNVYHNGNFWWRKYLGAA